MTDGQVDFPLTVAQRNAIIATIPWVAHAPHWKGRRCDLLRSDSPVYAYWTAEGGQREEDDPIRLKFRCKNNAHWVFLGLDGRIRVMCWSHLFYAGLIGTMEEAERYEAWAEKWVDSHEATA
jgi:hypothetical protein